MKKFLSFAASTLITASFLDGLYFSGIGCYIILIRSWKKL